MIRIEQARQIVEQFIRPLTALKASSLRESLGQVLAADVCTQSYFPAADCSMMDGYAVQFADPSAKLRIIGEVAAGSVPQVMIAAGECVRIFTGAPLPEGADAVIPQEETQVEGEWMTPTARTQRRWVRPRGSEGKPGQIVVRSGTRIDGAALSALAQAGCAQPPVFRSLAAVHIATGDELVDPTEEPPPGKIRETNSLLLTGLLGAQGVSVRSKRCSDSLESLLLAIPPDEPGNEFVLISGGASVGDYDFGARALKAAGFTIHFDRLNLRPGKPLHFATRGRQVAFLIPGNPVSHLVCFHTVIRRAVECFQGATSAWSFVSCDLESEAPLSPDARETFCPARVIVRDGRLLVTPRKWSSSGDTFSMVGTNALIRVPTTGGEIAPGANVRVLLLDAPGVE